MLAALKNLDDLKWADLADQGRALIVAPGPPAAPSLPQPPEWTDHNASDPGITLLDLLAFLTEQDIYRINRVPERYRRLMLALCGIRPRPAQPARVLLRFLANAGPVAVPASTECSGFRTLWQVRAVPGAIGEIQSAADGRWTNLSWDLERGGSPLLFGAEATAGAEAYFGFSEAPGPGPVSLGFVWAGTRTGEAERRRIIEEFGEAALERHHDVRLVWELSVAGGGWRSVPAMDRTRSLTLNGTVTVDVPPDAAARVVDAGPARIWIRCRIESGSYDRPPRLAACFLNGVEAEQAIPPAPEPYGLGTCTGDPYQRFRLPVSFDVADGMRLFTMEGATVDWERRDDLVASGPADRHYWVDEQRGEVVFGDGAHGRLAPFGSPCYVEYRATRGAAGNVAAGAIACVEPSGLAVSATNPAGAEGGADPETVEQASGRAIEILEAATRAMTAADIRDLCLGLPGALVARAEVLPNHFPATPCVRAAGITTAVIVPAGESLCPIPSGGLLAAVSSYLEARRIVGTRLAATAPTYIKVSVNAGVKALRGTDPVRLREAVENALTEFLHPLRGGQNGDGWPLGRDVYRAEILQLLDRTPGVDHVLSLELIADDGLPTCGNLCLPATGLTAPGSHRVEVS